MRRIPSLDGLRALSIGMVLVGHSIPVGQRNWFVLKVIGNGDMGVSIFFVISGFLITSLLLKEHNESGRISLKSFYARRAFRILPPFAAFLLLLMVLRTARVLDVSLQGWTSAFMFLRDYWQSPDWWTGHTWSLSIEEQFYLLWPACLALAGLAKSKRLAVALIIASPAIRTVCHLLLPHVGWQEQLMFHMRMDSLMMGCAVALFYDQLQVKWTWITPAAIFLFVLSPYLTTRLHGYYLLPLGYSLDNLAIAYLLLYAVRNPGSALGRALNHRLIVHVGIISYSLYLWQQLFLGVWSFPWGLLGSLLAAELSWRIIETKALRVRDRFIGYRELTVVA
jgi:peptidoglycan/LPS O-acetylase OafA/YrhL